MNKDTGSKGSGKTVEQIQQQIREHKYVPRATMGDTVNDDYSDPLLEAMRRSRQAAQQPAPETKQELDPWPNPSPLPEDQPETSAAVGQPDPSCHSPVHHALESELERVNGRLDFVQRNYDATKQGLITAMQQRDGLLAALKELEARARRHGFESMAAIAADAIASITGGNQ